MSDCVYPCPCGFFSDPQKPCTCAAAVVTKYQKCISGPLLDRIDIHIEVPRVDYEKLSSDRVGESSGTIRARIQSARDRQTARYANSDCKVYEDFHELLARPEITAAVIALGRTRFTAPW